MDPDVGRRKCLTVLGGTILWPLATRAQPGERVRRVGVLIYGRADNRGSRAQADSLREGLQELGWFEGHNLKIELRYNSDRERIHIGAEELVRTAPDVIVANTNAATSALQLLTRTIPIVFAGVGDPVAGGLVTSLNRPGGNVTGITNLFFSLGGKWLELLKEIAPRLSRVAIMYNSELSAREDWFAAIEEAAPMFNVTLTKLPIRTPNDIERAIEKFAAEPDGALIIVPPGLVGADRDLTLRLARDRRLPAIYYARTYSIDGGLMSYGADSADLFRQSATYVDRILRGAKPGELPVQFPNKFELVINRGTAKSMGLDIPPTLIARADEVIE
jgi:putative tryptophan/tyrosine transport system substrate-binding protein